MSGPALVQSKAAGDALGSGITVTWDATPTNGNLLVACVVRRGETWPTTISNSGWTLLNQMTLSGGGFVTWYYKIASSEPSSIVWVSGGGGDKRAFQAEFSGVSGFDLKGTAVVDQANATTHNSPSITPTAGKDSLLLALFGKNDNNESFLTDSGGWTQLEGGTVASGLSPQYLLLAKYASPTSGSYAAQATEPRGAAWCANTAAFNGADHVYPNRSAAAILA